MRREIWVAYLLLFLGGIVGIHKFYLNRVGWGVAYFLLAVSTALFCLPGGLLLIALIIDLVTLPAQVEQCNREFGWDGPWQYSHPSPSLDDRAEQRAAVLREADRRLQDFARRLSNLEAVIDPKRY